MKDEVENIVLLKQMIAARSVLVGEFIILCGSGCR